LQDPREPCDLPLNSVVLGQVPGYLCKLEGTVLAREGADQYLVRFMLPRQGRKRRENYREEKVS
jgi:hypothetical protein